MDRALEHAIEEGASEECGNPSFQEQALLPDPENDRHAQRQDDHHQR